MVGSGSLILVTGGAGFIGSHLCQRLLDAGYSVRVLDNLDPFYDPAIKRRNLELLRQAEHFGFVEGDIRDSGACQEAVEGVDAVIHLAALAGVRPSIANPERYMDVNVRGTQVLLDAVNALGRQIPFVFGSSSSVYGGNEKVPFSEADPVNQPVSPYAASKRAGELICATFHHLSGCPVTCLRFFTVYGPGQRPEMAIHKFSRIIMAGDELPMFGDGSTRRDYTYVDDIVSGVVAAMERADGYRIYNLGGSHTTTLRELIGQLEAALSTQARIDQLPEQPGDVKVTFADISRAESDLRYRVSTPPQEGVARFARWYLSEREAGRLS